MKASPVETSRKNDLVEHPKAAGYMPKRSNHRDMSRFNDVLKDCVDSDGDFFAVPINGVDLGMGSNQTFATIWQVGETPNTAKLRHVLYDYHTMQPLNYLTREKCREILCHFSTIVGEAEYRKMIERLEANWKKWRKDKDGAAMRDQLSELGEISRDVKKNKKSIVVTGNKDPDAAALTP